MQTIQEFEEALYALADPRDRLTLLETRFRELSREADTINIQSNGALSTIFPVWRTVMNFSAHVLTALGASCTIQTALTQVLKKHLPSADQLGRPSHDSEFENGVIFLRWYLCDVCGRRLSLIDKHPDMEMYTYRCPQCQENTVTYPKKHPFAVICSAESMMMLDL